MPKIDPITGCEVMTFWEFLGSEADREGKDPGDILDEINCQTDEDNRRMSEFNRKPEVALQALTEYSNMEYEEWQSCTAIDIKEGTGPDPEPNRPEKVLEVLEADSQNSYSGSKTFILARVRCMDEVERIAEFHYQYWSGSRMEPPEEDGELLWHDSIEAYHHDIDRRKAEKEERERKIEENRRLNEKGYIK